MLWQMLLSILWTFEINLCGDDGDVTLSATLPVHRLASYNSSRWESIFLSGNKRSCKVNIFSGATSQMDMACHQSIFYLYLEWFYNFNILEAGWFSYLVLPARVMTSWGKRPLGAGARGQRGLEGYNAQGYRWKVRWKEANLDQFINPEFLGADATGQRGLEGPFLGDNCFPPGLLWVDTKGLVGSGQKGLVGCFFRGLSLKWFFNHSMHYEVAEK